MARPIWKGALRFGLVTINIEMFTAVKKQTISFKLLHDACDTPLQYKRWCSTCKEDVDWADVVKGLKLRDGSYFILTKAALKKLKPEKTEDIEILQFVPEESIDTLLLDNHYYLAPQTDQIKPYNLLLQVMQTKNVVAIGHFVMHDKEQICAIKPYEKIFLLTTLNYAYELVAPEAVTQVSSKKATTKREEKQLAMLLVDRLTQKTFDISKYKDQFVQKLLRKIKAAKTKKRKKIPEKKREIAEKEESLMQVLKKSLKPKKTQ